jgi:Bardet-Biedl syndrome 5 protein
MITNLRIVWYSEANNRINLSVGYDCILNNEIKETVSAIKGPCLALYLRTRYQQSRYEFIFSTVVRNQSNLLQNFLSVLRSYDTTKMYRDLKIRGSIIENK